MSWSLPVFRVAGIQLRIHITFLLLIAWLAFGYYAQGVSAVAASRVLFVLLLFMWVLRALLATRMSYAGATQVAATVGQGFAFIFGFIGLLWNPFLIFIALFVYIGASQEAALAQMKDVSRRFPVSSAMVREFRTLSEDASLQEAVDALLATSQHDFPVVDETGSIAGVLTRHDLIAALRKNDPTLTVGDVMRRDIPTVTTGTRFEDAFRIMQECNCPAVPVLDSMKRLVGLLTPENVTELMMIQSAMPRRRASERR